MSPKKFCPTMSRFDTWSRAAMFAFALAAAPLLPAHAEPGARNGEDDRRARDGTTLSIPLSGIGVEARATPPVPKPGLRSTEAKATGKNDAATTGGDKDGGAAHERRSDAKDERQSEFR